MAEKGLNSGVSTRDIAKMAGCSHASVSRALRGDKKVGEELRKKILAIAEEVGYKPNPLISSLMATQIQKRRLKNYRISSNIGWLNTHFAKDFWHQYDYTRVFLNAAAERAKDAGYGFEEIWALEEGMTGQRLNGIAQSRGIDGFIIPGPFSGPFVEGFDCDPFSMVCISDYQPGQKAWHRVGVSMRKNVIEAYNCLYKLGYRRIAIALASSDTEPAFLSSLDDYNNGTYYEPEFTNHESLRAALSGYLYAQDFAKPKHSLRPFIYGRESHKFLERVSRYLKDKKPEALICNDRAVREAAEIAGVNVPNDIAVAHLDLGTDVEGWAGIETSRQQQAYASVDLLCTNIERNQRGLPEFPYFLHIDGKWIDGWTAPPRSDS